MHSFNLADGSTLCRAHAQWCVPCPCAVVIANLGDCAVYLRKGLRVATLERIACVGPAPELADDECDTSSWTVCTDEQEVRGESAEALARSH